MAPRPGARLSPREAHAGQGRQILVGELALAESTDDAKAETILDEVLAPLLKVLTLHCPETGWPGDGSSGAVAAVVRCGRERLAAESKHL
ncbi:hypothetical protein L837_3554 [Mycobacterium avium MAV_061107_1842]|nr:hypothetical protein L837_3554 [Mycobacterium avium MAV_061107_1842]